MMRTGLTIAALLSAVALAGCSDFDPIDKFQDLDIMATSKTPLKGERRPVFPSGVPGVPQGVPPEMVKGYQAPTEEPPPVVQAKPEKQKKKKVAAAPRRAPQPPPNDQQPQQQQAPRTTTTQYGSGSVSTQTIPGAQPTSPQR
jgi:hypothetical protein